MQDYELLDSTPRPIPVEAEAPVPTEAIELSRVQRVIGLVRDIGKIVAKGDTGDLLREIAGHPW